jgi:hypothetical protein
MARELEDQAARRLREIAAQEEAAAKQRLAVRTGAARSFARASARLEDARAGWERTQAETAEAKAKAVVDLLGTGMQVGEVAALLGVTERELKLKALRTAADRHDGRGDGGELVVPGTGRGGSGEGEESRLAR